MTIANGLPTRLDWHGLARDYYRSDEVFGNELRHIWRKAWLFACATCEVPRVGDFMTLNVGDTPILLVRDDDRIRAFHNICSHRGTLLCDAERGRIGKMIVCPYHQWSYTRSGALHSCRDMSDSDSSQLGLQSVQTLVVAGLVFVCLAETPPDAGPLSRLFGAAEPHGFERGKVAHSIDYRVNANWKIVWENNRECYHCDAGHPQYIRSNFDSSEGERDTPAARATQADILSRADAYWTAEGLSVKHAAGGLARYPEPDDPHPFPVSATRTVMVDGYDTESMDGQRVAPFMGSLRSPEVGVLRLRSVPSFWCHASCDHAVVTRVLPESRGVTNIRVIWLVDAAAKEHADYTLERLLPFWQLTSEQDWELCERAGLGAASPAYRPGPLSRVREYNLEAFFQWYLNRLR